jgi:glycosyltransferase involved in cell wall biosynthesis
VWHFEIQYRHPRLVIGVPVFNEGRFIKECLESVMRQTDGDFLVVVSDNGSTDNTASACADVIRGDTRFIYVRQELNRGSQFNFEYLRRSSASPFFAWVGGHDVISRHYVSTHLRRLAAAPRTAVSYCPFVWIDEKGSAIGEDADAGFSQLRGAGWWRLAWSTTCGDVAPIHGVFRRTMMPNYDPRPTAGCDHILLSATSVYGLMDVPARRLYMRRMLDDSGRAEYMERITGVRGLPRSLTQMHAEYVRVITLLKDRGDVGQLPLRLASTLLTARLCSHPLPLWYRVLVGSAWRCMRMYAALLRVTRLPSSGHSW